jgi:hypothetical protein
MKVNRPNRRAKFILARQASIACIYPRFMVPLIMTLPKIAHGTVDNIIFLIYCHLILYHRQVRNVSRAFVASCVYFICFKY